MGRWTLRGLVGGIVLLGLVSSGIVAGAAPKGPGPLVPSGTQAGAPGPGGPGSEPTDIGHGIAVGHSFAHDISPPLRQITPIRPVFSGPPQERPERPLVPINGHTDQRDPVVQRSPSSTATASAVTSGTGWEGIGFFNSFCNCAPPDTNGQVGPNNYVQIVNTAFQIWSKTGTSLYGPAAIDTIWSGFGGYCAAHNDGDPILLYDQLANRWLIAQGIFSAPYGICIAVSTSGDPTGSYNRYAFTLSNSNFPDYPHLGVWPDGYYLSVNMFQNGSSYVGPQPFVFDRSGMLAGVASATFQSTSGPLGSSTNPMLPADLDGSALPATGSPNSFAELASGINLYRFHVDWTTPTNTTFTRSASLAIAGFTQLCPTTGSCIPQPGTRYRLDGLGDRLMYRLAYRNFGDHEALVVNHSVNVGSGQAGVRWYEIRNPSTTPSIAQQGSYAPDTNSRWMGSAAMDKAGDIAVGYSVSSSVTYPSIRFAGRTPSDPLGTLEAEAGLFAGSGSQAGTNRWGDYSSLTVDPTDDCTLWYTTEYNNSFNWYWGTRIGSFTFPGCASSSKIAFTSAAITLTAGSTAGPITVQLQTSSGTPQNASSTVTVNLSSSSAKGSFLAYTGSGCSSTSITSVTVASGTSSAGFCYADTQAGNPTLTASATGYASGAQTETVNAGALVSIAVSPSSATVSQGGTQGFTASGADAYGNPVSVSNASWTVSPSTLGTVSPTTGSSVTFTASSTTTGTGSVSAAVGTILGSASVTVTAGDFSLSASPSSQTTSPATPVSYTVTITRTAGFTGAVTLSVSGGPGGASTYTFSPNPASTSSTLTVTTDPAADPGNVYTLTITGTNGSLSHTTTVRLDTTGD